MAAGDDLFDISVARPKPSRFQPSIKGRGKVKLEPTPSVPLATASAPLESESPSHAVKAEPLANLPTSNSAFFNGVDGDETETSSITMDVEEEDVVVKEFDVYINQSLDAHTKLYDMQYLLRPSWRPYEMDERCNEVRIKPKLSKFEIELSLNFDSDENYNKQVDDRLMITKQILSSSTSSLVNESAVGVIRGNQFHVNPLHAVVQFWPSMAHIDGQMGKHGDRQFEANSEPIEKKFGKSLSVSSNKGQDRQEDGNKVIEQIDSDERWVSLDYHASDSPTSCIYKERTLSQEKNCLSFAMNSSDYLYSYGLATSGYIKKTNGPSRRFLLTKPLEERLKQWLSEGSQVNRFNALLHLAPTESEEYVLEVLQHHAYLVQGLWVAKSYMLYDGFTAIFRDYILLQFNKNRSVSDSKLKVVKPDDVRKGLLKPLAIERPLFKDWKFKEDPDTSFIKHYPAIVREQQNAWLIREKEITESLPAGGRFVPGMLKNSANLRLSSKVSGFAEPGLHGGRSALEITGYGKTLAKGQEVLANAVVELLRLHKVLSLNSIIQGLQGKTNAALPEVESVTDQIAIKIHDVYVLKSLGKPALDQFRNVVIEYFIGKGRNTKVKKQEIKVATQYRLQRDVSDVDYGQVMNELCMSTGGSWVLKGGALK
ncbi:hypothetical protein HPP92_015988 [Vanilla planifolia]|uniref:DNA-directed RNA polymerase III subunit RPC5 n=1 Tax=Vanilla planifolia TaxID=51239 RepID=A0A835UWA9_VANPL|nr:hypothetical protein HPP92_015988 [Vanilla planifolia]